MIRQFVIINAGTQNQNQSTVYMDMQKIRFNNYVFANRVVSVQQIFIYVMLNSYSNSENYTMIRLTGSNIAKVHVR